MLQIKKGDYFGFYRDGQSTKRIIAISDSPSSRYNGNYCDGVCLDPFMYYIINVDNEVEEVLGNIFE